ncbi:hypothetical protein COHA_006213 [Chlorella ohadii]|uniref:MYND-type domain-containing protein n=1 Tax=Chlorella ohadii TaxID=2649997 RepID=A0AAD5DPF0_9CHLO|nr:hypothetical protein COHA_006213 [Chlorella ohadii]
MDNAQAFERVNRALQRLPADQHTEEMRRLQQYEQELGITAALARGAAAAGRLPPEVAFKLHVAYLRAVEHATLSIGAFQASQEINAVLIADLAPIPVAHNGTLELRADGSQAEQAQRALAAVIAGLLLNSVHPDAIAQRAPQPALAGLPQLRHRSDVSLAALHHSRLVACVAQRRLKLEEEDNTSPAWQAELKHCLLEAQLLLELAPDEPHHYLAASHFLEHAEFLDREGRAAALRLTLRGAKVAKQCKGEWPDWVRSVVVWCLMHPSDVANPVPLSCWLQGRTAEWMPLRRLLQVQQRRKLAAAILAEYRSTGRLCEGDFSRSPAIDEGRLLCAQCSTPAMHLKRCAACKQVSYCSRECQVKHWKEGGHKDACTGLAAAAAQRRGS